MFRQAVLQSKGLQYGRKGYVLVELRLSWVSKLFTFTGFDFWVCSGRETAAGLVDIHDSRAKVITVIVMVYGSRKVVVGYADSRSSCSVGHCGLTYETPFPLERGFPLLVPPCDGMGVYLVFCFKYFLKSGLSCSRPAKGCPGGYCSRALSMDTWCQLPISRHRFTISRSRVNTGKVGTSPAS